MLRVGPGLCRAGAAGQRQRRGTTGGRAGGAGRGQRCGQLHRGRAGAGQRGLAALPQPLRPARPAVARGTAQPAHRWPTAPGLRLPPAPVSSPVAAARPSVSCRLLPRALRRGSRPAAARRAKAGPGRGAGLAKKGPRGGLQPWYNPGRRRAVEASSPGARDRA